MAPRRTAAGGAGSAPHTRETSGTRRKARACRDLLCRARRPSGPLVVSRLPAALSRWECHAGPSVPRSWPAISGLAPQPACADRTPLGKRQGRGLWDCVALPLCGGRGDRGCQPVPTCCGVAGLALSHTALLSHPWGFQAVLKATVLGVLLERHGSCISLWR